MPKTTEELEAEVAARLQNAKKMADVLTRCQARFEHMGLQHWEFASACLLAYTRAAVTFLSHAEAADWLRRHADALEQTEPGDSPAPSAPTRH